VEVFPVSLDEEKSRRRQVLHPLLREKSEKMSGWIPEPSRFNARLRARIADIVLSSRRSFRTSPLCVFHPRKAGRGDKLVKWWHAFDLHSFR
jgi:hypothetical protein